MHGQHHWMVTSKCTECDETTSTFSIRHDCTVAFMLKLSSYSRIEPSCGHLTIMRTVPLEPSLLELRLYTISIGHQVRDQNAHLEAGNFAGTRYSSLGFETMDVTCYSR